MNTCVICGNEIISKGQSHLYKTCGSDECKLKRSFTTTIKWIRQHRKPKPKKVYENRICMICNNEYTPTNIQQKICGGRSGECRKKLNIILATKSVNKKVLVCKEYAEKWKIPYTTILNLGLKFLFDNPLVVEATAAAHKLSGSKMTYLTTDEKSIRKKATRDEFKKQYLSRQRKLDRIRYEKNKVDINIKRKEKYQRNKLTIKN